MTDTLSQSLLNRARQDKFILSFTVPVALKDLVTKTDRQVNEKSEVKVMPDKLQYTIFGTVVPEIIIPSITLTQFGQSLKVTSHTRSSYPDVTVNFAIDNQFNNYWYIWSWLNILNDVKTSEYDANKVGKSQQIASRPSQESTRPPKLLLDYQADITLYGLNEYNQKTVQFTYTKAFPVSLGGITYDYRNSAEIEGAFTFSFSQLLINLL